MPGRCFPWTKSLSFKALSSKSDAANICLDDSRSGSFSSIALKGDSLSKRSSWSGCSMSGCSPPIPNLRDVIHGSSKLLMSSKQSSASSCSSPRKSDYIHQSQTGEYYYRAPLKVKHAAKGNTYNNNNNNNKRHHVELGSKGFKGAGGGRGDLAGDNMCLVKGCCECSMASCDISSEVADHGPGSALIHINASSGSTSPKCVCPKCGEAFYKTEALELHQIARHAVSQLGSGNSSLHVVEMIFKTSWLTKEMPCGKIERILKIDNTQRAISEFEKYRNRVKERHGTSDDDLKNKTHHDERCLADGNELLRFFATSLTCSLGANSNASSLCSMTTCNVCNVIRWGFAGNNNNKKLLGNMQASAIYTTATSGKAHQLISQEEKENRMSLHGKHAMLVCRVIAGRIQKLAAGDKIPPANLSLPLAGYDSVARDCGPTANLDEVTVFDPKALLPCFVVIYTI